MKKVVVIGAGIGGLASAIRLAAKNHQVTVIEQESQPGGKMSEIRAGDFRFDTGPSLLTLPHLVEELFELLGEKAEDYLSIQKLEESCRYFYPEGKRIRAWTSPERFSDELESKLGEPKENTLRYLKKAKRLYHFTADLFIFSSLHRLKTFRNRKTFGTLMRPGLLDPFRSLHQANRRAFQTREAQQIFDRYATYNGSDPFRAPATLKIISHLEHNTGAFFPSGGMYKIASELHQLAMRHGITFQFNTRVESLTTANGKVTGVEAGNHHIPADIVISDIDIHHFKRQFLNQQVQRKERPELSSSALIFFWGMDTQSDETGLHNIFFSSNYMEEFRMLFSQAAISDDPTIYLYISSKMETADAPSGKENWFVMVNAPADSGQNWDNLIERTRRHIISKLEAQLNMEIEKHILVEKRLTPRDIERRTSSEAGALYGSSSNNIFSAFMRHPNFSKQLKGLYFTGGSVHPGGGIPLCLASAKIVSDMIPKE